MSTSPHIIDLTALKQNIKKLTKSSIQSLTDVQIGQHDVSYHQDVIDCYQILSHRERLLVGCPDLSLVKSASRYRDIGIARYQGTKILRYQGIKVSRYLLASCEAATVILAGRYYVISCLLL